MDDSPAKLFVDRIAGSVNIDRCAVIGVKMQNPGHPLGTMPEYRAVHRIRPCQASSAARDAGSLQPRVV
jgi:hypothetical protein